MIIKAGKTGEAAFSSVCFPSSFNEHSEPCLRGETAKRSASEEAIFKVLPTRFQSGIACCFSEPERYGNIEELRFRVGRPVQLITSKGEIMLMQYGSFTSKDAGEMLNSVCECSVYSKEHELIRGFVTLSGGARVGLCGEPLIENGNIKYFSKISSFNIRVPRELIGCAKDSVKLLFDGERPHSSIIAAPPGMGKTTFLRDLARCVSDGLGLSRAWKVAVADERYELTGAYEGVPMLNVGKRTDVIAGIPKVRSIPLLIRNMSPEVIITDELFGGDELGCVFEAAKCGIAIIASMHARTEADLLAREGIRELLDGGLINAYLLRRAYGRLAFSPIEPIAVFGGGNDA